MNQLLINEISAKLKEILDTKKKKIKNLEDELMHEKKMIEDIKNEIKTLLT